MVLKLPPALERIFWALEKTFQFFAYFWLRKLKPFSGKGRQNIITWLNQNLVIESFLENAFEATLSLPTNVLSVRKGHFSVFCIFLSDEVETVFWESKTELWILLNSNLVTGSWSYFEVKNNFLSFSKGDFSVFCKFLIDEIEIIFLESESKHQKLCKSKFGHRKHYRKCFRSYLDLKNKCSEHSKRSFFSFFEVFEWQSWNRSLGKQERASKII